MKKLILGCAVALFGYLMPTASAQDGCCPPYQYDSCCDFGGFDGFYFGGNIGVFTRFAHRNDLSGLIIGPATGGTPSSITLSRTSFTGGLQLGYDMQCNNKLVGLVVDWNWVNTRRKQSFVIPTSATVTRSINLSNKGNWFTTIRLRAGLTVCDALFYVTGGAAVTRANTNLDVAVATTVTSSSSITTVLESLRLRNNSWGWTAGAGTEVLLGCNWSFGGEFLWLNFGHKTNTFTVPAGIIATTTAQFSAQDCAWVGRFLLNYRFGGLCCN